MSRPLGDIVTIREACLSRRLLEASLAYAKSSDWAAKNGNRMRDSIFVFHIVVDNPLIEEEEDGYN